MMSWTHSSDSAFNASTPTTTATTASSSSSSSSSSTSIPSSSSSSSLQLPYDDCPICLCSLLESNELYETDCGHIFDAECLTKYLSTSTECPLDRRPVKSCRFIQPRNTISTTTATTGSQAIDKDLVLVKVKYNKLIFEMLIERGSSFASFRERCGKQFSLDASKLKLIYANRVLSEEASRSSSGGQWSSFKQVLQSEIVPTIQLIASQTVPTSGKWEQPSQNSNCVIQ